jgi:hypothetical protein
MTCRVGAIGVRKQPPVDGGPRAELEQRIGQRVGGGEELGVGERSRCL